MHQRTVVEVRPQGDQHPGAAPRVRGQRDEAVEESVARSSSTSANSSSNWSITNSSRDASSGRIRNTAADGRPPGATQRRRPRHGCTHTRGPSTSKRTRPAYEPSSSAMCWGNRPPSNTRPACRDPIGGSSEPIAALTRLDRSPPRDEWIPSRTPDIRRVEALLDAPPAGDRSVTGDDAAREATKRAHENAVARSPAEGTSAPCTCRDTNVRPRPIGSANAGRWGGGTARASTFAALIDSEPNRKWHESDTPAFVRADPALGGPRERAS